MSLGAGAIFLFLTFADDVKAELSDLVYNNNKSNGQLQAEFYREICNFIQLLAKINELS